MILHLFFVKNVCLYLPVFVLPYKGIGITSPVGISKQKGCPWPRSELPWLVDEGQCSWRLAEAAVLEGSSEELQSGGTQRAVPHAGSEITLEPLALA